MFSRLTTVLVLALGGGAGPARAQEIRVRVADSAGTPAIGAMISLVRRDGTIGASGIIGQLGRVRLVAPADSYRVLVQRPGLADASPAAVTLQANALDSLAVTVGSSRPAFPTVLTPLAEVCTAPGLPTPLAPVWAEVRKTFSVIATTEDRHAADLGIAAFERRLSTGMKVESEHLNTLLLAANRPENGGAGPALLRRGVVERSAGGVTWAVPDITYWLDPTFPTRHCFGLVNGSSNRVGLIGLRFRPVADDQIRIEGTFWLDPRRRELRATDYTFTRLPEDWRPDRTGGSIESHVIDGYWVTRFWYQRVPMLEVDDGRDRLRGFREVGAEVTSLTPAIDTTDRLGAARIIAQREAELRAQVARVEGVVVDTLGYPVGEAEVAVLGTDHTTTADRLGQFALDGLPGGVQIMRVRKVGYHVQYFAIRLRGGQVWDGKVALAKEPQTLGDIVVTGRYGKPARYSNTRKYDDFYRRRASKAGRFLTREDIDKLGVGRISDLLRAIPGVRVAYGAPGIGEDVSFLNCPSFNVAVWIDGQRITGLVSEVLPLITPSDVEMVEIYQRQSVIPAAFRDNACAAIVLWTR